MVRLPCRRVTGLPDRLRGLIGRPAPAAGTAWLFARCRAVHTLGMRYPIDVVFVDRAYRVCRVVPALAPGRMAASLRARHVLELRAGEAARLGLMPGVAVRLAPMAAPQ